MVQVVGIMGRDAPAEEDWGCGAAVSEWDRGLCREGLEAHWWGTGGLWERVSDLISERTKSRLRCDQWVSLAALCPLEGASSWGILMITWKRIKCLLDVFSSFFFIVAIFFCIVLTKSKSHSFIYNIYPNLWHPGWQPGDCCPNFHFLK